VGVVLCGEQERSSRPTSRCDFVNREPFLCKLDGWRKQLGEGHCSESFHSIAPASSGSGHAYGMRGRWWHLVAKHTLQHDKKNRQQTKTGEKKTRQVTHAIRLRPQKPSQLLPQLEVPQPT